MKEFAPSRDRTDEGWIKYDDGYDQQLRRHLYPPDAAEHPAKAPLTQYLDIIEYVSEPGETVMDIMAGTGSVMIGATIGRHIIALDIEDKFVSLMHIAKENLETEATSGASITIIQGDCRRLLPLPVDHIIFSPPYAQHRIGKTPKKTQHSTRQLAGTYKDSIDDYQDNPRNVGNLNRFMYCLDPSTLILKSDLTWVPLGCLNIGDRLIGVDEYPTGVHRRFRESVVEYKNSSVIPAYRTTFSDGTSVIGSSNHRWLVCGDKSSWQHTYDLSANTGIRHTFDPWTMDSSYDAGYVAGILDGEGSIDATNKSHCVRIAQKPGIVMDKCHNWLYDNDYKFSRYENSKADPTEQLVLTGRAGGMALLGSIRPPKLLSKSHLLWENTTIPKNNYKVVHSVVQIEDRELIDLQTSTKTFIANGLISHNSQAMEKVYKLCYQSIMPDGTLTVIIKDYIEKQERIYLSNWVVKVCIQAGFENIGWFKRQSLGTGFLKLWRSRGMATVSDEDMLMFRRN